MKQAKTPASGGLIKFRTGYSANKVERVQVIRETAACVYVKSEGWQKGGKSERREAKHGEFAQYHDTWLAAHAYLVEKAEAKVAAARKELERANGELGNIKGMKPKEGDQ
ncbi:MAG TPA: hypothetical protein DDZ22_17315 [Massilia sp.]|nr:hypothetical protein [Massilia sp.]